METIAIYPGSFDPLTIGHQNIVEKSERIFGKENVIIALGINSDKHFELDDDELRNIINLKLGIIEKQLPSRKVEYYIGFLTDYVRKKESEGYNVVVIRGLRNGHDFDYEYNQIRYMLDMHPSLNIMCLFADPMFMHVSSSAYRNLEKIKKGAGHKYLALEKKE